MRGLVGFHTKTIEKRVKIEKVASFSCYRRSYYKNHSRQVKIEKVASICLGKKDFIQKPLQNEIVEKIEKVASIFVV